MNDKLLPILAAAVLTLGLTLAPMLLRAQGLLPNVCTHTDMHEPYFLPSPRAHINKNKKQVYIYIYIYKYMIFIIYTYCFVSIVIVL